MSNVEDDVSGLGRYALRTARVEGLRRRMSKYVESHDSDGNLKELRRGVSDETRMGDLVDRGRDERV